MKKSISIAVIILLFISGTVMAKHSTSGRNPPKKLSARQLSVLAEFVPLIPKENDPIEIVALAMVETNLTPTAIGLGNYGILQINCTVHQRNLRKVFGYKNCRKDMLDMAKNVTASMYILHKMRTKYRQCRGKRVYSCYNGGQGWKVVMKRCYEKCVGKACRRCNRPARYADSVRKHTRFLNTKYKDLIYSLFKGKPAAARKL